MFVFVKREDQAKIRPDFGAAIAIGHYVSFQTSRGHRAQAMSAAYDSYKESPWLTGMYLWETREDAEKQRKALAEKYDVPPDELELMELVKKRKESKGK